ncbi:MAG TPA: flagellar biosynthetic protein FliO [Novimethylophilus sp.]|jgi:flagellar protein FliO/FliZ|uniref:flagellar biosynthetic protein FliO n=1 Tax=Novimethylophilus sp. TaxID=2137426 RepID=UPI002F40D87B
MAADQATMPISASPLAGTLQMLFGLGIVLAAIAGTAWLLRRLAPGQVGSAGNLHVVAAVAVGPKERVVLVDVGETRLVLGVAQGQVTLLHEMPRPANAGLAQNGSAAMPFVDKLKELIASRGVSK